MPLAQAPPGCGRVAKARSLTPLAILPAPAAGRADVTIPGSFPQRLTRLPHVQPHRPRRHALRGRVVPSANKNAVLPILCATLLTDQPLRLNGVPDITDVRKILDIFRALGSQVKLDETTRVLDLHHRDTRFDAAVHRLPEEMRSSIMLVPPLLARFGVARLEDNVKGCTLGVREIDPHVDIFRSFGGQVERADGSLLVRSSGPLHPPITGWTMPR